MVHSQYTQNPMLSHYHQCSIRQVQFVSNRLDGRNSVDENMSYYSAGEINSRRGSCGGKILLVHDFSASFSKNLSEGFLSNGSCNSFSNCTSTNQSM